MYLNLRSVFKIHSNISKSDPPSDDGGGNDSIDQPTESKRELEDIEESSE